MLPPGRRGRVDEVREAERLGLGAVFISERFTVKEAVTLSGAAGAVSERIGIATAATNHNTRHPLVTASYATTMHRLTGGRFALGLGRGVSVIFDLLGIPRNTTAAMEDFAGLMRRLWRGEMILGQVPGEGLEPSRSCEQRILSHSGGRTRADSSRLGP